MSRRLIVLGVLVVVVVAAAVKTRTSADPRRPAGAATRSLPASKATADVRPSRDTRTASTPLPGPPTRLPRGSRGERAAAAAANALLSTLPAPPGATQSPNEPSGDDTLLSSSGGGQPATVDLVDEHQWWIADDTPQQALDYIRAHVPAGAERRGEGSEGGPTAPVNESEEYEFPSSEPAELGRPIADFTLVQLAGGGTGVRIDVFETWMAERPAAERIPPGVRAVVLTVFSDVAADRVTQRPVTVSSTGKVHALIALVEALPRAQPGAYSCPVDLGVGLGLSFRGASGRGLAKVDAKLGGCGGASVRIRGHSYPQLDTGAGLQKHVERIIGSRLDTAGRP